MHWEVASDANDLLLADSCHWKALLVHLVVAVGHLKRHLRRDATFVEAVIWKGRLVNFLLVCERSRFFTAHQRVVVHPVLVNNRAVSQWVIWFVNRAHVRAEQVLLLVLDLRAELIIVDVLVLSFLSPGCLREVLLFCGYFFLNFIIVVAIWNLLGVLQGRSLAEIRFLCLDHFDF